MFTNRMIRRLVLAPAVALACAGIAACGSTKDNAGSGTAPAGKADVAAARAAIAPYIGKPSAFPVDRPLAKGLPPGKKLAFLQCVTPFCALLAQLHGMAAKLMGTQVEVVKATGSSDSIQTALSSIAAQRPAALLLPAVNLGALGGPLTKLTSEGIPVAGAGVMGGKPQGIDAPMNGPYTIGLGGRILADWAIVNGGTGGASRSMASPSWTSARSRPTRSRARSPGTVRPARCATSTSRSARSATRRRAEW
jgi:ribose transport system substrate-binding protein